MRDAGRERSQRIILGSGFEMTYASDARLRHWQFSLPPADPRTQKATIPPSSQSRENSPEQSSAIIRYFTEYYQVS